jgi:hypothetical protein
MTEAFLRYGRFLERLLWARATEVALSDDIEEMFATSLSDCRGGMTDAEEAQIEGLIVQLTHRTHD